MVVVLMYVISNIEMRIGQRTPRCLVPCLLRLRDLREISAEISPKLSNLSKPVRVEDAENVHCVDI